VPPEEPEVAPVAAFAPPLTLPDTPGTAPMPGTFMLCVAFVFCDAVVD
jgi:hypothetical protein